MEIHRSELLRTIRERTAAWIKTHATKPDGSFDKGKLSDLVTAVADASSEELSELFAAFEDRTLYPERPMVRLYGCVGSDDDIPDIWLLGWRDDENRPEGTEVHDHHDSKAAIRVLRGRVTEIEFTGGVSPLAVADQPFACSVTTRTLSLDEVAVIDHPEIHQVVDVADKVMSVTLHAYYPPLDEMNQYVWIDGKLFRTTHWKEEGVYVAAPESR